MTYHLAVALIAFITQSTISIALLQLATAARRNRFPSLLASAVYIQRMCMYGRARAYLARNLYKKRGTLGSTPKRFDPLASVELVYNFILLHPKKIAETQIETFVSFSLSTGKIERRKTQTAIRAAHLRGNVGRFQARPN